ncbi:Multicopper oxidase with three cupredoxin domains (includes cell division protein FtsP and spore coat protein CotA) [Saccharopolyspora kobensis]|uniref:Multicopper oxidase with three cupredoxin domains (Includes cell division protein FtsP and spore coat protein CotA) n=3 Tax=Saccharopolyspora kobensis TaxID=146035 RepID=A0A1H5TAB2_9PSEU|nr:multicopper oxidase family protein [Saccharopolyspora kobensis]SEF59720.1 Multicopper oxidase with three cupredoxin domains (includes cell division protein FtsP and spore coat protein CotA) [Saccharopolyspora kobensis]SFC48356.1 Multicopper oxidase with three cupredoxin domains (includes cell division protein FtsP and spore coat protein CotA) [Saccharopolyspora kobensis]
MTTVGWIIVDHAIAVLGAIAWFGAGVTAARRRARPALALLGVALLVTLTRAVSVAALAARGWWFVEEKVLLGLPLLAVAALAAAVIAGPGLLARARSGGQPESSGAAGVVALLTAGYAASASFVVTFLAGPPTWGTALIAIAVVLAGALLTMRVLAPSPEPRSGAAVSRRRFFGLTGGLVVLGAAGAGFGFSARPRAVADTGGGPGPVSPATTSVTDLRGPAAPAPGGVRREHVLTARKAAVRLETGRDFDAWTFDGAVPGPAITATEGDLIEVKLINQDIDGGVTLHWHGYDVPCGEDGAEGVTQEPVAPGGEFRYRFRADQVGTYWYHTHFASHIGVRRGLYGTLVVRPRVDPDPAGLDLTLPVHTFDGAVTIAGGAEHRAPVGSTVRLRLVNTDSDPHRFALAGTAFRLVAVDGRDLERPGEVSRQVLRLPAAGRYDVVFTMPSEPVVLVVDEHAATVRLQPQNGSSAPEPSTQDASSWPELDLLGYGAPLPVALRTAPVDRRFTLVLDRGVAMVDGSPAYAHTVNGRGHPSIPDQLVSEGDVVRMTVVNRSLETHPWHLHGHPVLVLSRDGQPASGSPLWVDTFDVRPGEVWEVVFRASNPGIWMNHCHNLPHAHEGMMLQLRYDGITTPFGGMHMAGAGHHG